MRIYLVAINGQGYVPVKASRASVAVHRFLDHYSDAELDGAKLSIRRGMTIKYAYRVVADVPCEPAGASKRDFVSGPMSKAEAQIAVQTLRATRPELRFQRLQRVEV